MTASPFGLDGIRVNDDPVFLVYLFDVRSDCVMTFWPWCCFSWAVFASNSELVASPSPPTTGLPPTRYSDCLIFRKVPFPSLYNFVLFSRTVDLDSVFIFFLPNCFFFQVNVYNLSLLELFVSLLGISTCYYEHSHPFRLRGC